MRFLSFLLMLAAAVVLAWDVYGAYTSYNVSGFSSLTALWLQFSRETYLAAETAIIHTTGWQMWIYAIKPVMGAPLALLLLGPGFLCYLNSTREIKVRPPSAMERELVAAGYSAREIRALHKR